MRIDVLCSDPGHPVIAVMRAWAAREALRHSVGLIHSSSEAKGGDILFLVSCTELIRESLRRRYRQCMVLHTSDLPRGRGWSPHVWEIIGGAEALTVTLLEADDPVDSGAIWAKRSVPIPRSALHDEINELLFKAEAELMSEAIALVERGALPTPQPDTGATFYRRRWPADSEIDPSRPLVEAFNLLRVSDPKRYPAFFIIDEVKYTIEIKKARDHE